MNTGSEIADIVLGVLVIVAITAITAYFVAQEFGYTAVDRARLRALAREDDLPAQRALAITARTSFMLSGAQLGITVTGLVVGYVAEPLIGAGVADLLGVNGVPTDVGTVVGTSVALLLATVVQMVFGELFPKNLAIARPEPVARRLAFSTTWYLRLFGWVIRVFDAASNLLLRALRIEPVHDVDRVATPRDLEAIIDESRESGELPSELSTVLDRVLDFTEHTARAAMIPRPQVATVNADTTVRELVNRMASGHSRYPVVGTDVDDVIGVVDLRHVLTISPDELERPVRELARKPAFLPESLPLPKVLDRLRDTDDEFACVVDEYGGLAGVITTEDIAEELVGEIGDEHDPGGGAELAEPTEPVATAGGWTVPGSMHIDEASRLVERDLPTGCYQTLSGLIMARLGRMAQPGDTVTLTFADDDEPDDERSPEHRAERRLTLTVLTVRRRVPSSVRLRWQVDR